VARDTSKLLLSKSMQGLYIGALMFLGVIILGTTAYWTEGWKLADAFYMVIITVFSVGYEEVEPVTTPMLRAITILIIIAGDGSKVYFVGSLVRFITEGEIGKAMEEHRKSRDIETITGHAIICGYGRIGQTLARELTSVGFPFLIVDNNAERVALAHSHGYQALAGDAGARSCWPPSCPATWSTSSSP
jgi:voltage-gated potassium channel